MKNDFWFVAVIMIIGIFFLAILLIGPNSFTGEAIKTTVVPNMTNQTDTTNTHTNLMEKIDNYCLSKGEELVKQMYVNELSLGNEPAYRIESEGYPLCQNVNGCGFCCWWPPGDPFPTPANGCNYCTGEYLVSPEW